ncbi:MAG: phasin family protein [Anaerolineales bacterium]|nr:phasin family protein [Anaerolineales bacterium]
MLIIKRYPNRKLYDTDAKKYITLDGISDLIRDGEEVQVIDHATGEDLTAVILTQIIFEQEKKQAGFLPRSVLRGLVQAGGDTMGVLRRTLASPLDMLGQVDEEIRRRVKELVKAGEMAEEEGQRLIKKLLQQGERMRAMGHNNTAVENDLPSQEELSQRLAKLGVPTREDIETLNEQLEALELALERMNLTTPNATTPDPENGETSKT